MADIQLKEKLVSEYFEASNTKNETKLLACFADDIIVVDEGKTYTGIEAVRSWRNKVNTSYNVRFEIIQETAIDGRINVFANCTGNFPGSPLVIKHSFVLRDEKIIRLEIT